MKVTAASLAPAIFAAAAMAQEPAVNCNNDICYSMLIPETTASEGSGPIYFQIYGPDSFGWIAMGTGQAMIDSNMFIMYQDGEGNVTVSPRRATGNVMPMVQPPRQRANITLLDGSGVADGFMTANFRCDNCEEWRRARGNQVETLDFESTEQPMIGAWWEGDSLDSSDIQETISMHNAPPRQYTFDLTAATAANIESNPFVGELANPNDDGGDGGDGGEGEGEDGGAGEGEDGGEGPDGAASGKFALMSSGAFLAAVLAGIQLL